MSYPTPLQPIDKQQPEIPRWQTILDSACDAGKTLLHGTAVAIETVAVTIHEGNEAARHLAREQDQILEAFTALPADQQNAYLALQAQDDREHRQRIRHALSPVRAVRGLFHLDHESVSIESPMPVTGESSTAGLVQV